MSTYCHCVRAVTKFANMQDYHDRWDEDDVDEDGSHRSNHTDWRSSVYKPFKNNDINAMKDAGLASAQLHMLELAHNAESETVQYNATAFLLSQAGHGPMAKIEHTHNLKQMPANQLRALIQSKLAEIQKRNPNFDVQSLVLLPNPVPRETSEDSTQDTSTQVSRETIIFDGPKSSVPRETQPEEDDYFSDENEFDDDENL